MANSKEVVYGTDFCPAGTLNWFGVRPGSAFQYEGPIMPGMTWMTVTFTTTYEALEQVIVPPPLKVCRDFPPTCSVSSFTNPNDVGLDGRLAPYSGFIFLTPVEWKGTRGLGGWEYVGSINAEDHTLMADLLIAYGQLFGMLKKLADIRYRPIGDEIVVTVDRRGVRLATLRIRQKEELPIEQGPFAAWGFDKMLTVREIPTVDFKGYVDRSVCVAPTSGVGVKKVWAAEGSIEFGHDELDQLDILPVVEAGPAFIHVNDFPKEAFSEMYVLEQLPLNP